MPNVSVMDNVLSLSEALYDHEFNIAIVFSYLKRAQRRLS